MNMQSVNELVAAAQTAEIPADIAKQIIPLIDLTSLNDTDDVSTITALCEKAITPMGAVAAVCIYPQFIAYAKAALEDQAVKIATVANFPGGNFRPSMVIHEIVSVVRAGADEVDVVIPYYAYLQEQPATIEVFIDTCKRACQQAKLKVILETGALKQPNFIAQASQTAIEAGADFLKTSTGKVEVGATLEAAAIMLLTIKQNPNKQVGFKASGGIRTPQQAASYLKLAELIMGKEWISPSTFRFGASGLLDALLKP